MKLVLVTFKFAVKGGSFNEAQAGCLIMFSRVYFRNRGISYINQYILTILSRTNLLNFQCCMSCTTHFTDVYL